MKAVSRNGFAARVVLMDPKTVHTITRGEIEHILKCLRFIDAARNELEKKPEGNVAVIRELRASVGGIYDIVKKLPEA